MVQKTQFCLSPAPFDDDPVAQEERESIDYSIKITTDMISKVKVVVAWQNWTLKRMNTKIWTTF